MRSVVRLVTFAELTGERAAAGTTSVSARLDALLSDGAHVVLLDDRGWTSSGPVTSTEEAEDTARTVVGPDEPAGGLSAEEMAAGHWATLAHALRRHGVAADPAELAALPHDVVLGERLRAQITS
jgi:hypothetical protein